jgi:hypothetical protein
MRGWESSREVIPLCKTYPLPTPPAGKRKLACLFCQARGCAVQYRQTGEKRRIRAQNAPDVSEYLVGLGDTAHRQVCRYLLLILFTCYTPLRPILPHSSFVAVAASPSHSGSTR